MRISSYVSAACLLTLLLPSPSPAETAGMVLGHAGQLQRALTGTYGELFTDAGADATAPVLAVETVAAAGEVARVLVPGTLDSRIETAPRLFQDAHRDSFVMLWRSQAEEGDSHLRFATFDGAEWSEVFTLERDGEPISLQGEPLIAETHDTFELDFGDGEPDLEDGEPIRVERRVLHLLWQGGEDPGARYAALTFVEGEYLGWHNLFVLDDIFLHAPEPAGEGDDEAAEATEESESIALTPALAATLDLRTASDGRSVLVTFANPASQRLGVVEVSPLPLEIGLLGDQVRDRIFALADLYDPQDLGVFSDEMRAAIVILGQRFDLHEAHADYVAGEISDWILDSDGAYGWSDLELLGNDARDRTIDAGQEVTASLATDPADQGSEILRINVAGLLDGQEPDSAQVLDFRVRCDLPAPAVGDGAVTVYPSRGGGDLLIAWEDAESGQIHWVESRKADDGAWSESFSLTVGESLPAETVRELLARRIR